MTENHAKQAGWHLLSATRSDPLNINQHLAAAQTHATLALVEQQRIANEQMAEVIAHVLRK